MENLRAADSRTNNRSRHKDLAGKKFGRWTVLSFQGRDKRRSGLWLCRCDCGTERLVPTDSLNSGRSRSCGCLTIDATKGRTKHADARRDNSGAIKLYHVWQGMKQRCENAKHASYRIYGGRGISVCQEWHDYPNFKAWAFNNGYFDGCNIDRKDTNGNYDPGNCRFVKPIINANNRRNNRILCLDNECHSLTEWTRILGISVSTIYRRLKKDKSIREVLNNDKSRNLCEILK